MAFFGISWRYGPSTGWPAAGGILPSASLVLVSTGVVTAVPLFYPVLVWVVIRGVWIGVTGRGSPTRSVLPVWVLLAATVFLAGREFGKGMGRSKKEAEQRAAREAYARLLEERGPVRDADGEREGERPR